jgi:dephospho-CoA kinase
MSRFCVCVTGGIASGKSQVTDAFAALGVVIADADVIAREVVAPGSEALQEIRAAFGDSVFTEDGSLNRAMMRNLVFADAEAKKTLESITHPRIRERMRRIAESATCSYSIASVPLWVETQAAQYYSWVQRVLVVSAPRALRIARLMQRDGIQQELTESMLAQQATDAQRYNAATDIVINDADKQHLHACVSELHQLYLRMATNR